MQSYYYVDPFWRCPFSECCLSHMHTADLEVPVCFMPECMHNIYIVCEIIIPYSLVVRYPSDTHLLLGTLQIQVSVTYILALIVVLAPVLPIQGGRKHRYIGWGVEN